MSKIMYKAQLVLLEPAFDPTFCNNNGLKAGLVESIDRKVSYRDIELPIVPSKEMQIDIREFEYGFTDEEMEALMIAPNFRFNIDDIDVCATYIRLYLKK
jgi:hypothetical protein